jgi:hypothetical protein
MQACDFGALLFTQAACNEWYIRRIDSIYPVNWLRIRANLICCKGLLQQLTSSWMARLSQAVHRTSTRSELAGCLVWKRTSWPFNSQCGSITSSTGCKFYPFLANTIHYKQGCCCTRCICQMALDAKWMHHAIVCIIGHALQCSTG